MKRWILIYASFVAIIAASCFTCNSVVNAATMVRVYSNTLPEILKQFSVPFFSANRSIVLDNNKLQLVHQRTDNRRDLKSTHFHLQQTYLGFQVFGGYAILHSKIPLNNKTLLNNNSDKISISGVVFSDLQKDLGAVPQNLLKMQAVALENFKSQFKFATQDLTDAYVKPIVYIDEAHLGHWAFKLGLTMRYKDALPSKPTAIVDAKTLQIYQQWDEVKTQRVPGKRVPVNGMGVGGNKKIGLFTYGKNLPLLSIMREPRTQKCYLENDSVRVVDMKHRYTSVLAPMKFNCNGKTRIDSYTYWTGYDADGYDRFNEAFSPSNDAMYVGQIIKRMYSEWYDVDPLAADDSLVSTQLIMCVHYGDRYANAFWDGKTASFGDGDYSIYPLISISIASHEISHAFTEQYSNLIYFGQSGGLNESFSDMAAQAAEYYAMGTNDWQIGAEILKKSSGLEALRYMDVPSRDGMSIDAADQYYRGLDVHYSSGVFNRLFYLLAHRPEWNVRKAFDLMVEANMNYWTPYSNFIEAGCGILQAAKYLGYSVDDVKSVLNAVAIKHDTCDL